MPQKFILVADIGATNARFAVFDYNSITAANTGTALKATLLVRFPSNSINSFQELLDKVWQSFSLQNSMLESAQFECAVIAAAGPISNNNTYCQFTNLSWSIDISNGLPRCKQVYLINDFVAQAAACVNPGLLSLRALSPNPPAELSATLPRAVIGAGTGLGACVVVPTCTTNNAKEHDETSGKKPQLPLFMPSETGHCHFPFLTSQELEFAHFAKGFLQRQADPRALVGDVMTSGFGLTLLHIYFHKETLTPVDVAKKLTPENPVTMYFARFFGRICQTYILSTLALGGLFISGGVIQANPMLVEHPDFLMEFTNNPNHGTLLASVPVYLIDKQEPALIGAAHYACCML